MIPYGKQWIDEEDIAAVVDVLRCDWLTTGPKVAQFESAIAAHVDADHAVAVNSGTAALHAMMFALDIGPGDEVIVPAITFVATANCVVFQGGKPVIVDVLPESLLIDPQAVEAAITPRTKAIIAVDYAGQPCDYVRLQETANRCGVALLTDGCHALGARYQGRPVGSVTAMTAFSFHPVKPITTGEGGMVTTNNPRWAQRMRQFRSHGISVDAQERQQRGVWFYEMQSLGYNYRLSDIQCALGLQQLTKLDRWISRRQAIARLYDQAFAGSMVRPLETDVSASHAFHLYVVRVRERDALFGRLRDAGIGGNVHYIPVHLHPFYRRRFNTRRGMCPVAETAYEEIISLPMFPSMTDGTVQQVIRAVTEASEATVREAA